MEGERKSLSLSMILCARCRAQMGARMKFIGITGGVGAGKSLVLSTLKEAACCRVLPADDVGNAVKLPGQPCYEALVELLGKDVLQKDGLIDREKMAERIFRDPALLERVNAIIHPAVKQYILQEVKREKRLGKLDFFFLEAALLIEDGYGELVDELWYIHADKDVRARRLKESRGYSEEKINRILASQLSEEAFRQHCDVVIENNGDVNQLRLQVLRLLEKEAG